MQPLLTMASILWCLLLAWTPLGALSSFPTFPFPLSRTHPTGDNLSVKGQTMHSLDFAGCAVSAATAQPLPQPDSSQGQHANEQAWLRSAELCLQIVAGLHLAEACCPDLVYFVPSGPRVCISLRCPRSFGMRKRYECINKKVN